MTGAALPAGDLCRDRDRWAVGDLRRSRQADPGRPDAAVLRSSGSEERHDPTVCRRRRRSAPRLATSPANQRTCSSMSSVMLPDSVNSGITTWDGEPEDRRLDRLGLDKVRRAQPARGSPGPMHGFAPRRPRCHGGGDDPRASAVRRGQPRETPTVAPSGPCSGLGTSCGVRSAGTNHSTSVRRLRITTSARTFAAPLSRRCTLSGRSRRPAPDRRARALTFGEQQRRRVVRPLRRGDLHDPPIGSPRGG